MVDTISKKRRSENMRRIRSKGMRPEIAVRRLVHSMGYRFRLHSLKLPGKPDIVLSRLRKIVDVRGCFWHQHKGCVDAHIPKSSTSYWRSKLRRNVRRDRENSKRLRKLGWRVFVVWECEIVAHGNPELSARLARFLAQ
ncbi:MAG: very short patch repair endonuclease [Candidatus Acidiferrales bacterium]